MASHCPWDKDQHLWGGLQGPAPPATLAFTVQLPSALCPCRISCSRKWSPRLSGHPRGAGLLRSLSSLHRDAKCGPD